MGIVGGKRDIRESSLRVDQGVKTFTWSCSCYGVLLAIDLQARVCHIGYFQEASEMAEQIVLLHKEVQDHLEKSNFKYKEAAQRSINERKLSRKAILLYSLSTKVETSIGFLF
ncbi:uncharacterized protein LOC111470820 [Cucurbita maxima]|uniref:Uncharacterized protein LOC111470820 n=1 Tax=Cucurbita maxima TaxID=3661 RepID=A0A6J1IAW5_CUCMA|nr:uncharacterized protein LOC111470820 [Cucurbita maxima]